jgi:hypothetical protein
VPDPALAQAAHVGFVEAEGFDVAQRRRAAEYPDLHHGLVFLEARDVREPLDVERWRDPDADDPEGGDIARITGRRPFCHDLARIDAREVGGREAERGREKRAGPVAIGGRPGGRESDEYTAGNDRSAEREFHVTTLTARRLRSARSRRPAGAWSPGIGVVTKSRRATFASHRARRADRVWRALSVAIPVFAYI